LATLVVRALDAAGIAVDDVELRQPSLDDVFFALTGHAPESDEGVEGVAAGDAAPTLEDGRKEQALARPGPDLGPFPEPENEAGPGLQEVSI
jgi:hypothetical protein